MTRCLCESCSPDPAPTYTEKFRLYCEAKDVRRMHPRQRKEYLDGVKKNRGQSGLDYLMAEIRRQDDYIDQRRKSTT